MPSRRPKTVDGKALSLDQVSNIPNTSSRCHLQKIIWNYLRRRQLKSEVGGAFMIKYDKIIRSDETSMRQNASALSGLYDVPWPLKLATMPGW
jgi:hypothetical protein